ncbi:double zinc ribbon and ankyrin repeat-containing protein 1 [Nematolebias whitei]|uniref:double zinc ribbon and ankyrin repeat-containing protein 1 n=1 Tax=Nematolebias whitei TaxID=451745 RepID=UPI00189906CC|nr:double zinc ribbon and ankyrin repeat-containing protein 1 [Nematolebias whitei]
MAAGAVSAPLIIPIIQLPTHRVKNHIDTRTPVSIQSDSAGALLFFTLDGSRPEVGPRGSAGGSRKYTKPILLPAGQVSIRAVAVTIDGRQSSIVSKVFYVDQLDSSSTAENQEDVLENLRALQINVELMMRRSNGDELQCCGPTEDDGQKPSSIIRSSLPKQSAGVRDCPCCLDQFVPAIPDSRDVKKLSSTQERQVQRETDFLRCACCLSFLPSDPFARFCAQCGAVAPLFLCGQWLPPAEGAQMRLCVTCKSLVPINTRTCLICEASIGPQTQPQAHLTLKDHLVCVSCGSGNPAHTSRCLTCDDLLLLQVGCSGNSAPSVHATHSRMFTCSRCKRLNRSNARFCDWCSSKLTRSVSCVECWRCGASGHPYALYCAACGVFLEGPAPPTSSSNSIQPITCDAASGATTEYSHNATRQAAPFSKTLPSTNVTPPTITQSTQTVGLYYPSAIELQRKEQQSMLKVSRLLATTNHRPPLTTISPGRGFWRKQLDHVCAHLRSYTQNNVPFRALLGEPRLGQMVSAVIQEDPHEVSLTISFMLSRQKEPQGGPDRVCGGLDGGGPGPASPTETLSRVTERFANSNFHSVRKLNPNSTDKPLWLQVTDSQLLKELGPSRGRIRTIQQLLDQGANPSCCGGDGRHALLVAVVNGHHDVLPVLVQRGADVDQQSGPMKNTALHEAAALGSEGLQSAALLLRCKASVRLKNAAGQMAYDLAVKSGCSDMVSVLAAQTGPDIQGRPRLNLDVF